MSHVFLNRDMIGGRVFTGAAMDVLPTTAPSKGTDSDEALSGKTSPMADVRSEPMLVKGNLTALRSRDEILPPLP